MPYKLYPITFEDMNDVVLNSQERGNEASPRVGMI